MFSNSTGFWIHNSKLYNVAGDVNLQTHQHLTIQDHHTTAFQPPVGSTSGLTHGSTIASQQYLPIQNREHEATFQPPSGSTAAAAGPAASEQKWVGVARNARYGIAARPVPYSAPKILLHIQDSHTF
jgi:hypothetical protein